jgi:hypothetical protein
MERRGRGRCIFAMMSEERWLFVCGERELRHGDVRGLKVREEKFLEYECTPTTRA